METTSLYIKNMVCPRCISTVSAVLSGAGIQVQHVTLGEAIIQTPSEGINESVLREALQQQGFELLSDREKQITEKIKATLIDYLEHFQTHYEPVTTSVFLAEKLDIPYQQLSKIFSRQENNTIEKYFIRLKIEKVKELLSYHQLTLSEIAYQLKYSSVQHLSNQFKKITGLSVSDYKNSTIPARTSLDAL